MLKNISFYLLTTFPIFNTDDPPCVCSKEIILLDIDFTPSLSY